MRRGRECFPFDIWMQVWRWKLDNHIIYPLSLVLAVIKCSKLLLSFLDRTLYWGWIIFSFSHSPLSLYGNERLSVDENRGVIEPKMTWYRDNILFIFITWGQVSNAHNLFISFGDHGLCIFEFKYHILLKNFLWKLV